MMTVCDGLDIFFKDNAANVMAAAQPRLELVTVYFFGLCVNGLHGVFLKYSAANFKALCR